jgi:hypothetical protein
VLVNSAQVRPVLMICLITIGGKFSIYSTVMLI